MSGEKRAKIEKKEQEEKMFSNIWKQLVISLNFFCFQRVSNPCSLAWWEWDNQLQNQSDYITLVLVGVKLFNILIVNIFYLTLYLTR